MNLEPETRNGYFISAEMKRVWAVEMELLNKLLEVCKKYNLRIFAEGGTLLGAVREHGYIPWDDDIDMAMPREDYDKLREVASEEFKPPYFFQCGYTDLFPNGLTRLRMDGTAAILYNSVYHKCHQGIFIDIFPLDALPDNTSLRKSFIKTKDKMKNKLFLFCSHRFSFKKLKYDLVVLKTLFEIGIVGFHRCFKKYDSYVKQFSIKDNQYLSLSSWFYHTRYVRDKHWYDKTLYIPFEDILIPVPCDYEKILTLQYGDFMKPVNNPTLHGSFLILDPDHSYQKYLPKLRKEHTRNTIEG